MRLRYMREQRDQMKQTKVNKRKAKFNLDNMASDEEEAYMGFTHGGKRLDEFDYFKDDFPVSSDEDDQNEKKKKNKKGKLDEDMVTRMNFGGGEFEEEQD